MVFTVFYNVTHTQAHGCVMIKMKYRKESKALHFSLEFWRWVSVDVLLTSHWHRSLGKENHFKNDATWVRGSAAASKPTVSFVAKTTGVPVQSPLQGNQQRTQADQSLCHLRYFHKNILFSWRACRSVFLSYVSEDVSQTPTVCQRKK